MTGMRRRSLVSALLAGALGLFAAIAGAEEIVLLNWREYVDPALLAAFEQQTGVHVNEVNFESDDGRDAMMIETEGVGYDVVLLNGAALHAHAARGWLAPIDRARVPNLEHVDPRWRTAFPGAQEYGVPYFWGYIGLGYRTDLVAEPPRTWLDILRPGEHLRGRIAMLHNAREVTAIALLALGLPANSAEAADLAAAAALLAEQKPYVRTYEYLDLTRSGLIEGEIAMSLIYSGDWIGVHKEHPHIELVVPPEGTILMADYLTVASASRRQAAAWDFINFLNEPEHARQLAEWVTFPSPNRAAVARLPREHLDDPAMYPPPEMLDRFVPLLPLPAQALRRVNAGFAALEDR
jgi:spermidine/putrescine transport system substrate-binding protein